jgi:hypothetical protein
MLRNERKIQRATNIHPASIEGQGIALKKLTEERNWEGVVAKRKDSRYLVDTRSSNWLKMKNWKQPGMKLPVRQTLVYVSGKVTLQETTPTRCKRTISLDPSTVERLDTQLETRDDQLRRKTVNKAKNRHPIKMPKTRGSTGGEGGIRTHGAREDSAVFKFPVWRLT